MKRSYLQVTFDRGKPIAGYYYLPPSPGDTVTRTERREAGILIDYSADGRALGIEFTAPSRITLEGVNQILADIHHQPATRDDLLPLLAA
jgi:uncharacterized protein YuzE